MKELKDIVLKEGDIVYFTNEVWHVNSKENNKKFGEVFEEDRFVKIERPIKYETIYEAPKEILEKEEKEYLEAVIRPFRDKEPRIWKVSIPCKKAFISIGLDNSTHIHLPYFDRDIMYKGIKLDKSYTLEELGLFKGE